MVKLNFEIYVVFLELDKAASSQGLGCIPEDEVSVVLDCKNYCFNSDLDFTTHHGSPHMKEVKPIQALLSQSQGAVLAVIVSVDGASYRPVGAMMTILDNGECVGSLSSGCVEADIVLHAQETRREGKANVVRYGKGSKFLDIQLPCGGGLEIILIPNPDLNVLSQVNLLQNNRKRCTLEIDIENGAMALGSAGETCLIGSKLNVEIVPEISFFVFGKGPEADVFITLVTAAGYPAILLSPDVETIERASRAGCMTKRLTSKSFPTDIDIDERSAIILFFHDHDWEPLLLFQALQTAAFYIGAQGSFQASKTRLSTLKTMGIAEQQLQRLHGPVGLIPSVKDPRTLAVSVMAEIVGKAISDLKF
jgi:xanthine dehydrogenase accessory factor